MMRKHVILVILFLLCTSSLSASEYSEQQAIIHYNQGVDYQNQGYVDSAIDEYKNAINYNSELYRAYYNLGFIYIDKKDYASAERMFEIVIEQIPNEFSGYYGLGIVYQKTGQLYKAQSSLEKAESLSSDNDQKKQLAGAYHDLGVAYAEKKEYAQATIFLTKVLKLDPDNFSAHYNLGIIKERIGVYNDAINEFKNAVLINPESEEAHLSLAALYLRATQRDKARIELLKARQINPANSEIKQRLEKVLAELDAHPSFNSLSRARTTRRYRSSSTTDDSLSWVGLIFLITFLGWVIYANKKKYVEWCHDVIDFCHKIWKNPIRHANALASKALSLNNQGDSAESVIKYKEAMTVLYNALTSEYYRLNKDRLILYIVDMRNKLASICIAYVKSAYLSKGESYKALEENVQKVMALCGEKHSLTYIFAELLYLQNNFKEALRRFREAAECEPTSLARIWIGILHYKLSNYTYCIRQLSAIEMPLKKHLVEDYYLNNDVKELLRLVIQYQGLSYYAIGDWNNVIRCFESLRSNGEIDNDSRFYLAKAYQYAKDYNKFIEVINECVQLEPDDADLLLERAKGYRKIWMLDEASQDLRKAVAFKSEDRDLHYEMALVCALKNDFNGSIACFNKLIQLKKDDHRAYFKRGMVYEKACEYNKAIESYLIAIKHTSEGKDINTRIGIAYCKNENYEQALPFFAKAKELGDNSDQYLYYCGLSHAKTNNASDAISAWEKLCERSNSKSVVYHEMQSLKEALSNNSKPLFNNLCYEVSKNSWEESYALLKQLKKIPSEKESIKDMIPYVRNRLCPELLHKNRRFEAAEVLREGLRDDPTNYTLLHNLAVLYYWWAFSDKQEDQPESNQSGLWGSLIGYWTAVIYNDKFWGKWSGRKKWLTENEPIGTIKIQNNLMRHVESKILSSIDVNKQKDNNKGLPIYEESLKKLNCEKRFISYYKELHDAVSDEVSSIPDTYSETLIKELGVQDYIIELADMAIRKYPRNENIRKIKLYLSPFKYIAVLLDEKRYLTAIKELEKLPVSQKANDIVIELTKQSKLRLGASYLMEGSTQNDILQARTLWGECAVKGDLNAIQIIEEAAIEAMKKYKNAGRFEEAIQAGELAVGYGSTDQELLSLLSIVLKIRGVNRWTTSREDDGVEDLERSVKFNPENMVAKSNLATMYNLLGIRCADSNEFSRAADYFISSLKLVPDDKTVLNNLKKVNSEKHREYLAHLQLSRGR